MAGLDLQALAAKVKGKNDDEIHATVEALGGPDKVIEDVLDGMKSTFAPERAAGESAVSQYDVDTAEGTKSYQVKVAGGRCDILAGTPEPPRVTLALSLPNFLRLMTGSLNGMQAFMSGQLKVTGDVMFAQTLQSWFPRK